MIGFVLLSTLPPAAVVFYTLRNPPPPEPDLPIAVSLDYATLSVKATPDQTPPALVPTMVLRNPSSGEYRNLVVTLNRAFYYRHDRPVSAGEELRLPLAQFITKDGGIGFIARGHRVERATVFAQLPDGSRGVREIEFDSGGRVVAAADDANRR